MCLGVPMQVMALSGVFAECLGRNGKQRINMMLLDQVQVGDWILTFLDTAREHIDAKQAQLINAALDGLSLAQAGDMTAMDACFADLIDREPQLPDFLRKDVI